MKLFSQQMTFTGTVHAIEVDNLCFKIKCRSGDSIDIKILSNTSFETIRNLDEVDRNRYLKPKEFDYSPKASLNTFLSEDQLVTVEGVFHQNGSDRWLDARIIHLLLSLGDKSPSEMPDNYLFESIHWWKAQMTRVADTTLQAFFGDGDDFDFSRYRTILGFNVNPGSDNIQGMAPFSRFIYDLSAAYNLTGCQRYLDAATAAVTFFRNRFRSYSEDGRCIIWAYGRRFSNLIMTAQGGDDAAKPGDNPAVALYEQIYALSGLAMYHRVTQAPEVLSDIICTVRTFNVFFKDPKALGYFSHLDLATMTCDSPALGKNQARKNWNSIGDHIPAYLINVVLALESFNGETAYVDILEFLDLCRGMLRETANLIVDHFPETKDGSLANPFVRERFHADWSVDKTWDWQQDRAIVGHNLKIAWNLIRLHYYFSRTAADSSERELGGKLKDFAVRLADGIASCGGVDPHRGGCFDCVERQMDADGNLQFPWLNTKDFWQQEQAILAYYILYGLPNAPKEPKYLALARETSAFWNIFFLDHDNATYFFRVTDNGIPIVKGQYGQKTNFSTGYHVFELCYLAHVYIRCFVDGKPLTLYYKPSLDNAQGGLNVLPDFLPEGHLRVSKLRIGGRDVPIHNISSGWIPLGTKDLGKELVVQLDRA